MNFSLLLYPEAYLVIIILKMHIFAHLPTDGKITLYVKCTPELPKHGHVLFSLNLHPNPMKLLTVTACFSEIKKRGSQDNEISPGMCPLYVAEPSMDTRCKEYSGCISHQVQGPCHIWSSLPCAAVSCPQSLSAPVVPWTPQSHGWSPNVGRTLHLWNTWLLGMWNCNVTGGDRSRT